MCFVRRHTTALQLRCAKHTINGGWFSWLLALRLLPRGLISEKTSKLTGGVVLPVVVLDGLETRQGSGWRDGHGRQMNKWIEREP